MCLSQLDPPEGSCLLPPVSCGVGGGHTACCHVKPTNLSKVVASKQGWLPSCDAAPLPTCPAACPALPPLRRRTRAWSGWPHTSWRRSTRWWLPCGRRRCGAYRCFTLAVGLCLALRNATAPSQLPAFTSFAAGGAAGHPFACARAHATSASRLPLCSECEFESVGAVGIIIRQSHARCTVAPPWIYACSPHALLPAGSIPRCGLRPADAHCRQEASPCCPR